jgi:predicted esterase
MLLSEQEQKQKLESMLKDIEEKLVTGGHALEEKEREQAQKYREF